MAITENTFTGNGSNLGPFTFTFQWLESNDIKITVDGVLKVAGTHYNLQSLNYSTRTGGQVLFTSGNAPANNAVIRIYRDTDDSALSAIFYSGSAIRSQDLNDNFLQNLYIAQETNSNVAGAVAGQIPDESIGTSKLVDQAVTAAKIADGVTSSKFSFLQSGAGAVSRTVENKLKDVVSVKDFGAVGDGVVNDTTAFQSAANSANGGLVFCPPGTYNITSAISTSSQFFLSPNAIIPNQYLINADLVDAVDRDYEAMMGMGYFNIWLDGITFNNPSSGSFVATLWRVFYDGTPGTFTVDQAGGPFSVGASNGLRWDQTVAGAGDTYRSIEYRIEDASIYNSKKATLSFFVTAASGTPSVRAEVVQFFGSGGTPSADVVCGAQTFQASTTTQRFSLTVDMPSTASKTFGNNIDDCVKIRFYLPINATFNVVFNEVKFERGPIRTPFSQVPLPFQHTFIDRYLQYTMVSIGFNATSAGQYSYASIPYKTEMRKIPSFTFIGGSSSNLDATLSGNPAITSIEKYGGTAYIFSAASGACYAINKILRLDARL